MTGTILWTDSAGFSNITGTSDNTLPSSPSASGILTVPPLVSGSGQPLTLIVHQVFTNLVSRFGSGQRYEVDPSFRGRILENGSFNAGLGATNFLFNGGTFPLAPMFSIMYQTSTDIEAGGPIDLFVVGSPAASSITGLIYAMVVDFEFDIGFVPRVNFLEYSTLGSSGSPPTSINAEVAATTGTLLTFLLFYGVGVSVPVFSALSPSQSIIDSDSVQYGDAAFAFETFISPIAIPGGIDTGLPAFASPFVTWTTSWTTGSIYTQPLAYIWEPTGGSGFSGGTGSGTTQFGVGAGVIVYDGLIIPTLTTGRSFAQVIGA